MTLALTNLHFEPNILTTAEFASGQHQWASASSSPLFVKYSRSSKFPWKLSLSLSYSGLSASFRFSHRIIVFLREWWSWQTTQCYTLRSRFSTVYHLWLSKLSSALVFFLFWGAFLSTSTYSGRGWAVELCTFQIWRAKETTFNLTVQAVTGSIVISRRWLRAHLACSPGGLNVQGAHKAIYLELQWGYSTTYLEEPAHPRTGVGELFPLPKSVEGLPE